ncbi:hypothetical protein CEXT_294901 [Caerostris extrusa]|uniref:Uncharacterized protein n=1 Tax=Caerostris extrusa TaxID=172846 RepID=A0AAV4WPT4_CAEEX|nr:hypothetical protein CEXT_294901 [Caerostris extrusa]
MSGCDHTFHLSQKFPPSKILKHLCHSTSASRTLLKCLSFDISASTAIHCSRQNIPLSAAPTQQVTAFTLDLKPHGDTIEIRLFVSHPN